MLSSVAALDPCPISSERTKTQRPMSESRLRRWQQITAASLFVGYAGYYLGRTCLSIAKPLMVEPGSGLGLGLKEIGLLDSIGVTAYAFGKVINGVVVDRLGGRRMFLFGMVATIALTAIFGLGAASRSSWGFGGRTASANRWAGRPSSKRRRAGTR